MLHRIDALGLIVLPAHQYRRILDQLNLHEQYIQIIRAIQEGHDASQRCARELSLIDTLHPTHLRPSIVNIHSEETSRSGSIVTVPIDVSHQ